MRTQPPNFDRYQSYPRRGPVCHSQIRNKGHTICLALLEVPHCPLGRLTGHDTTLERTPSHDRPGEGAYNHFQHNATGPTPLRSTRVRRPCITTNRPDHIHCNGISVTTLTLGLASRTRDTNMIMLPRTSLSHLQSYLSLARFILNSYVS